MRTSLTKWLAAIACLVLLMLPAAPAGADDAKLFSASPDRIAIYGYDPVGYFTDGSAMKGSKSFEYVWNDTRWRFASRAHRDMFVADPDRYAPQFGGFCAGAVIGGVLIPGNPEAWAIVDGKLYMVAGPHADMTEWQASAAENIRQGDKRWPALQSVRLARKAVNGSPKQ